jgi:hypothetical protein
VKKQRAKKTPPQEVKIAQEAGREYREIAEVALATATPDEVRQLVLLIAGFADGLAAKVWNRNQAARQLLEWGKGHDQARLAYFGLIEVTSRMLARFASLSPWDDVEHRDEILKLAAAALDEAVCRGCPPVEWPDESIFPIREPLVN